MTGRADAAFDVVVVGSGIAGLTTALHAAHAGAHVLLVTKDALEQANTRFAQGGIAAALFDDDSAESHAADTLRAGAGLCDPAAVEVLVHEGPARIRELIALGVAFDTAPDGALARGLEAAHSAPRVLHAGGDATGAEIERALCAAVRATGVVVREHAFLVDLVEEGGRVAGVDLLVHGQCERHTAPAVVLATGGAGQLYAYSTNPEVATGDGIAAALRVGAEVRDLEFVQFHPTITAVGDPFLVSEAVRGEGAVLRNDAGHRFALDVHPDGELAPRDTVARAIAAEMRAQGGRPVVLDATAVDRPGARLRDRFPTIDAALRDRGIDWTRDPVPVTPAAHYLMGGVRTDLEGRTTVPGLYAVGEVACTGVHGANRLASNSLLEGAVFGARCGLAVVADARDDRLAHVSPIGPTSPTDASAAPSTSFSRAALQQLMWLHVGLERYADGLDLARRTIAAWRRSVGPARSVPDLEDANLLLVAGAVVDAASARTGSVGAHFRRDDPGAARTLERAEAATC